MALQDYRSRSFDAQLGLATQARQGVALIEELISRRNSLQSELIQRNLDLEIETDARRRLQREIQASRELSERQGRRQSLVALIDASPDGYVFHDRYITKTEKGGVEAADALHDALKKHLQEVMGASSGFDIIVKMFTSLDVWGGALKSAGILSNIDELKTFVTGFNQRHAFFELVDVGKGRKRVDLKIRERLKILLESSECSHIVIGCGHESSYAAVLSPLVEDNRVLRKITLLEGTPVPEALGDLGLKEMRLGSIFKKIAPPTTTTTVASLEAQQAAPPTDSGKFAGRAKPAAPPPAPKPAEARQKKLPLIGHRIQARSERLGPILKDRSGHRIDRPLQVDADRVETVKNRGLCFSLYLKGECTLPKCKRNHKPRAISNDEFDILWSLIRKRPCIERMAKGDCTNATCVYGHKTETFWDSRD